jgi:hypothetical protein
VCPLAGKSRQGQLFRLSASLACRSFAVDEACGSRPSRKVFARQVTPCKSFGMAKYIANNVPGMDVPNILKRMKDTPRRNRQKRYHYRCGGQSSSRRSREWLAFILWRLDGKKGGEMAEKAGLLPQICIRLLQIEAKGAQAPFYFLYHLSFSDSGQTPSPPPRTRSAEESEGQDFPSQEWRELGLVES